MKNQRKYDREFKLNSVKLYRESGKSLRKELANVKQERDILKKAVAIFSKAKG